MTTISKASYTLCDACRRPIRTDEGQRLIHGFRIHNTSECWDTYSVKVEKGVLKVPFNQKT